MGDRKGLVEVHVDDVEPHVPWPGDAEDRIEVGAVVVREGRRVVDRLSQFGDVLLEQAEGVRVGQHDARYVVVEVPAQARRADQATTHRRAC